MGELERACLRFHWDLKQAPDEAAINCDGGPVDVAGAFRSKERDNGGEFLRSANAASGNLALPAGEDFFRRSTRTRRDRGGESIEARGARKAWTHVVYSNAVSGVFIGERSRQARDRCTDRIRKQEAVYGLFDRRRSNGNQTSPLIFLHAWQSFLREVDGAHQKLVESCAPVFRAGVLKRVRRRTAGIGNADIEAAKAGFNGSDERSNC